MTGKMTNKKQKKPITTSQYQLLAYDQAGTGSGGKSTIRIRNPGPSDVLCGRGGGINAHPGNVAFRELVQEKKERYNLAANKQEKAEISQDIVDHVKKRGGRFLHKDDTRPFSANIPTSGWWIEIDDIKAIAKTSQALREGAPRIRAKAAKQTTPKSVGKRGRKSLISASESVGSASPPAQENEELAETEVIHPIIRGYQDGIHRGKRLIPVVPTSFTPTEKKPRIESPKDTVESHAPTPPPTTSTQDQDTIETPTSLSAPGFFDDANDAAVSSQSDTPALTELDSDGFHQPLPLAPSASAPGLPRHPRLNSLPIMNPASTSFANIVKPDIRCARMHSLAMSEISSGDDFRGDESFSNPFENEEKFLRPLVPSSTNNFDNDLDTSGPSVSSINRILKAKSSDSVSNDNKKIISPTIDAKHNSRCVQSLRSFMSDLSDMPDSHEEEDQDFHEGLKNIYDAVYPGFTCPRGGDSIPTHLIPINFLHSSM